MKCVVCNTHDVAKKGGLICRSPRCKRQYVEQRATMDGTKYDAIARTEQNRQSRESTKRLKQMRKRIESPQQEARRLAGSGEKLIESGADQVSAVWTVATKNRVPAAQVLHAWRSTTTSR